MCGRQFRADEELSKQALWDEYLNHKQTAKELAERFHVSKRTIHRELSKITLEWQQPNIFGEGYVHMDAFYWGHNWGILLALEAGTSRVLYLAFIKHETIADYVAAVDSITQRGYKIKGLILDGFKSLYSTFKNHKLQMCQFHMQQIARRYLTKNPRLKVSKELQVMMEYLTKYKQQDFEKEYAAWKKKYYDVIYKKTVSSTTNRWHYTHKKLHALVSSIDYYLSYLFTYQRDDCKCMPNTNNPIEGTFSALSKKIGAHNGISEDSRKRLIIGFFLA